MLHEEVNAVFLRRDRVRIAFGDALHDLDVGDVEFVAARRACVGADDAGRQDRSGRMVTVTA